MSEPNEETSSTESTDTGTDLLNKGSQGEAPETAPTAESAEKTDPPSVEALTAESFTVPEGTEIDQELMSEFLGLVNNQELSAKDRAQGLVDLQAKAMNAVSEKGNSLWLEMRESWAKQAESDPDVGGEKLGPALANINKLIDKYAGAHAKELRDTLSLTGMSNSRALIFMLNKIAAENVAEGSVTPPGAPATTQRSHADLLYPNHPN